MKTIDETALRRIATTAVRALRVQDPEVWLTKLGEAVLALLDERTLILEGCRTADAAHDDLLAERDAARAELDHIRKTGKVDSGGKSALRQALHIAETERDQARAEVARLRPVLDALLKLYDEHGDTCGRWTSWLRTGADEAVRKYRTTKEPK